MKRIDYFPTGSVGRMRWWLTTLAALGVVLAMAAVGAPPPVVFVVFFIAWVYQLSVSVARLHDAGKSGWWLLLGLVPLAGLYVPFLLGFHVDNQKNQYGEPTASRRCSRSHRQNGYCHERTCPRNGQAV